MAQSRPNARVKETLTAGVASAAAERDLDGGTPRAGDPTLVGPQKRVRRKPQVFQPTAVKSNRSKANVERHAAVPIHSNMKTKKEDPDRSIDEEPLPETSAKTRGRRKAEASEEDKAKLALQTDSKIPKKNVRSKVSKVVVRKRPMGIQKTLRNKKVVVVKDKLKNVIKQKTRRGRKPAIKTEPVTEDSQEEVSTPLIPAAEIKKELIEESPNSRSSSPRAGRRQRVSSDMAMMKSLLGDSPSSLVLGPRTSPYSMRSERSNSPSTVAESKNLRSGRPRKLKNNLLNEVVKNEQKKRRRLLSDSKPEGTEGGDDSKKPKRGRSCSREDSELSKCSDVSESDVSLTEPVGDADREVDKKLEKSKTELDVDNEHIQISNDSEKVPSINSDSKIMEPKPEEPSAVIDKPKRKLSLKRSTSLDSDNNNSNRLKLENIHNSDVDDKSSMAVKTENDTLFTARSSILTSMSKTFNSKEVSKNIRRARRGRKTATMTKSANHTAKNTQVTTTTSDSVSGVEDTLETISKEISDLIKTLDVSDVETTSVEEATEISKPDGNQAKSVAKFYNLPEVKPLTDNNSLISNPDTPIKEKDPVESGTPLKSDDSENIRLHFEGDEDSPDKSASAKDKEITYKCTPIASIDKLMDRLKTFEEFDKKRQTELMKSTESKPVMVTNDVVLIPKSGVDVKPLKDLQTVRSPEKPIEKENVLSCFENNSAISIVKRDQVRKSLDVELPNSVTLIKRNSLSSRKESTGSNHSRESTDAISIFEKSLGKDVTLTEIRKSVDKSSPSTPVELHQFATLHPNNPPSRSIVIDANQISILPRVSNDPKLNSDQPKRQSKNSILKLDTTEPETDKMATIAKIKSPTIANSQKPPITITSLQPVAIKSPEVVQPMETEVLAPPLESVKSIPENIVLTSEVPTTEVKEPQTTQTTETVSNVSNGETPMEILPPNLKPITVTVHIEPVNQDDINQDATETKPKDAKKPLKSPTKTTKTKRISIESQPGPSNVWQESPETQKNKENILRTLGLLTHKAAKEARIEKQKEKERIYAKTYGAGLVNKAKTTKSSTSDYTGTLKTIIKLNRAPGEREKGKKYRSSLKMTFQKSKNRAGKPLPDLEAASTDDTYYTIERREGAAGSIPDGGHRKTHYSNRLNYDAGPDTTVEQVVEPTKEAVLNLVIPEKASSFSIHPDRLCMDQCFYCGGKFGLFDTPCHIAQMKSSERQKKVLDNEEKLTIDSCLCDACYRHVDRRANCPSYRRNKPAARPPPPPVIEKSISPTMQEESDDEQGSGGASGGPSAAGARPSTCHTAGCSVAAEHSIRRKWLIKMRSSVNKLLKLELDYPGLHTIPLCSEHYRVLAPLMSCVLCRRRITKHHNVHTINQDYEDLNPLLTEAGVPVQFTERPVLCKLCRYYCSLLQRPHHNAKHARSYRRRLLQIYNIEVPPESESETDQNASQLAEDFNSGKQRKKTRTKSKQRRSAEAKNSDEGSQGRTSESSPDKVKDESNDSTQKNPQHLEEDIESLISSNKILVPGVSKSSSAEPSIQSDNSDGEIIDYDTPLLPLDKQTELQYLLQKQNNPAQFLHKPNANLTQKQKSMLKAQNVIQKPGQFHRIHDKNAKRIQKLGQIVTLKDKPRLPLPEEQEMAEVEKPKEAGVSLLKNISLNEECTIESVPNKKPADINTLKNKWQMSESFTQVKRNLSELSKNLTVEKPTKRQSDVKYSNPVRRLETNPSISVRELFPGEEEMNLQCNIEFNNVRGVTPEGWEKCNTIIQYDADTKKLWTDLQRPYGNQSSFLRHLLLLEKYFRNGDLVLANNATSNAANYSDSVQSRLRAYDNIANDAPRRSEPAISLIEYRKQRPNTKSLLKSNQLIDSDKPKSQAKFLTPTVFAKPKPKDAKSKPKALPPELIAINTPNAQDRKAIQSVLHNIQQLVKGVSAADPTEVAAAPLPPQTLQPPRTEMPKKQKTTSKPWRPTLMPITQENLARIAREPPQVAVDGRSLPSLVQVMSSGNRYHITLQDYNKMCVMRREKLQQLHDGDPKTKKPDHDTTLVTEIQPSTMLGNGGTVKQTISSDVDKSKDLDLQIGANAATILKNVGLKNITIAPIPAKTATITSHSLPTLASSSASLLVASAQPLKIPQLSITTETVLTPALPIVTSAINPIQIAGSMMMPKIPKSLTVIPQMVPAPSSQVPPGLQVSATPEGPRP